MPERQARKRSAVILYLIAAAIGVALWIVTTVLSGRREAWDSPLYWTFAYPVALACSFALGYWEPRRAWRWALTIMLVQPVVMAAMVGVDGMLVLGLMVFGILAIPAVVLSHIGAGLNRH